MARFRGRIGRRRCVGFATARNGRPMSRRQARGNSFELRWQRCVYAATGNAGGLANSSFEACSGSPPERIVYLWNLDARQRRHGDESGRVAPSHAGARSCSSGGEAAPRFGNAQRAAGRRRSATDRRGASAEHWIDARHFERTFQSALARDRSLLRNLAADAELLWSEIIRKDGEREIALRGEARYVRRLDRGRPVREQWLDSALPLRLESRERGRLDTLRFSPFELPPCGPGQVLIEVKAAGMNFRDVLKALALYPGDAPDARIFGDEVGGIVKEVGSGVTHVAPGDRVFGLAVFGIATHAIARAGDVRRIPAGLTFEAAATLPVVFMTAWHALQNVARLRKGERILVHAGAGGVGMAAIQIAQHLGAEVIATAGSPSKRALLKTLGVNT